MAEFDKDGNLIPGTSTIKPDKWDGPVNPETSILDKNGIAFQVEVNGGASAGPLKDLYQNPYSQKALYYPRDLGQLDKGHSVQFDIKDVVPLEFSQVASSISNFAGKAYNSAASAVSSGLNSITNENNFTSAEQVKTNSLGFINSAVSGTQKFFTDVGKSGILEAKTPAPKISSTIRLYMPDSLSFGYSAQYDKLSVAEAINSVPLIGQVSKAATSFLSDNELGKMASAKIGYTFNPQQQTMFEGVDFREFEFEFIFTPTSRDEAIVVQNIIKELRRAAAPTKVVAAAGFFWVPPSIFNISFFFNQQPNYSIPPIRPCVLQSVVANLAPNGWAAMNDGSPVQTTLSLSFKELDLVDRESIKQELTMS